MILTPIQLVQLYEHQGFSLQWAETLAAVAKRESAGDPAVVNKNPATGDNSIGLLQINLASPAIAAVMTQHGITEDGLKDPATNARAAYLLLFGAGEPYRNADILWYIDHPYGMAEKYRERYEQHLAEVHAAVLASG